MNVMLLSDYEADKLLILMSKRCCIWCRCHQMHWRLNIMSKLLHSIVKRSNARWRLFVDEIIRTASDVDVIKCIDDCFVSKTLHSASSRSNEKQLMFELLHSIAMRLNALTIENDVKHAAFDRETIKCTLTIVWINCQSCIWCRCHQMHWRLFVDVKWLHSISNDQMHWRNCLIVKLLHLMLMSLNAR